MDTVDDDLEATFDAAIKHVKDNAIYRKHENKKKMNEILNPLIYKMEKVNKYEKGNQTYEGIYIYQTSRVNPKSFKEQQQIGLRLPHFQIKFDPKLGHCNHIIHHGNGAYNRIFIMKTPHNNVKLNSVEECFNIIYDPDYYLNIHKYIAGVRTARRGDQSVNAPSLQNFLLKFLEQQRQEDNPILPFPTK